MAEPALAVEGVGLPAEGGEEAAVQAALERRGLGHPARLLAQLRAAPRWSFLAEVAEEAGASEDAVLAAVAGRFGLEALPREAAPEAPPELLAAVPRPFAESNLVYAFADDGARVRVAVGDPAAEEALADLGRLLGRPIVPALMEPERLLAALTAAYDRHAETGDAQPGAHDADRASVEDLRDLANQAPVVRLVNRIFREAIDQGASDIHIEPEPDGIVVRYRVDGILAVAGRHSRRYHAPVVSRLKIMAGLDIAERRLPLDGRIGLKLEKRQLDIRMATSPTVHGEGVVLRILDKSSVLLTLDKIGLADDLLPAFEGLIAQPNGIVLVTGPTGSGKTTTLYAALNHLNRADTKIITVEDPVEYELRGVNQIPVNPQIGLGFARALRSILRQDPDVVMVGEIRDAETAQIAIQAALTGHLVLSTLHTNDAPSAVTRLVDMGIERLLVASSLGGVLAQRLCRRLHTCKVPDARGEGFLPVGCGRCDGGYRGRLGIHELMVLDDELRTLVNSDASAVSLRALCEKKRVRTLLEDGLEKVRLGLTSRAEVLAAAGSG